MNGHIGLYYRDVEKELIRDTESNGILKCIESSSAFDIMNGVFVIYS